MEYGLIPKIDQAAQDNQLKIQQVQPLNEITKIKENLETKKISTESLPEINENKETKNNELSQKNIYQEVILTNLNFGFNNESLIVEIASNDGYLLQYFKEKNIPVLGIEPTANTAKIAIEKGIESVVDFFGSKLANERLKGKADLILGNNVLAHVPDINDFVKGVKIALKPNGVNTFEFPHLSNMIEYNQFDTIYHEHFSYLSLYFLIPSYFTINFLNTVFTSDLIAIISNPWLISLV